jgi:hypothetical protein
MRSRLSSNEMHPMRCTRSPIVMTIFAIAISPLFVAAPAMAQTSVDPLRIEQAIKAGVKRLYDTQRPDGTWEDEPQPAKAPANNDADEGQWGGTTAMAVYALLVAGEKPTDERLAKAIDFLHKRSITGTYAVAFKCLVWHHMPSTPAVKQSMNRDARLMASMAFPDRKAKVTVWPYAPGSDSYSLSRVQYATLALWAAAETGIEIPLPTWQAIRKTWETGQQPEGGWAYFLPGDGRATDKFEPVTASMTAAALASLYIAHDFTQDAGAIANPRGNVAIPQIDRGLKWLADKFQERVTDRKVTQREFPYAQLYAIERVGLASGLRQIGANDWYAIGANWLLKEQNPRNGSWTGGGLGRDEAIPTSWAILFLQRGRMPVAINKLDYSASSDDPAKALWNQRPRDVANLTRWLSKVTEREFRWQLVGAADGLDALLESPVLYLSGSGALQLKPEAQELLKQYALHGGLIVAHADASNPAFAKSAMELGTKLFQPYEFRELADSHVILSGQNYPRSGMRSRPPPMRSIGNGARELMIVIPTGDPARHWQARDERRGAESWQVAANVVSYAAGKTTFYPRGRTWLIAPSVAKPTASVAVGRLKFSGNWDPEPVAIRQLANHARRTRQVEVTAQTVEAGQPIDPKAIGLLHVAGTGAFALDDAARKAIATYIDAGGTVLFEAVGGDGAFGDAAKVELAAITGQVQDFKPLRADHPILAGPAKLDVSYRPFNMQSIADPTRPALLGLERDGRVVALLSREDLTCGWLGVPTDGIAGYEPTSAREIATRLLASIAGRKK